MIWPPGLLSLPSQRERFLLLYVSQTSRLVKGWAAAAVAAVYSAVAAVVYCAVVVVYSAAAVLSAYDVSSSYVVAAVVV